VRNDEQAHNNPAGTLLNQSAGGNPAEIFRAIETARWHIVRYDALRASAASRASFVITADGVLIAGVALLMSEGSAFAGGFRQSISWLIAIGALLALVFAAVSIVASTNSMLSSRRWRHLFGEPSSFSAFYQHSDTFTHSPTYAEFEQLFVSQSSDDDLKSAIVNLWVVMKTHAHRYAYLRRAVRYLKLGLLVLLVSVATEMIGRQFT
jgi:hypothetical protein